MPEQDIEPVDRLPVASDLPDALVGLGQAALSRTVIVKLNGGLGTSMGLERAKSLLEIKDGLSFLEILARQSQLLPR